MHDAVTAAHDGSLTVLNTSYNGGCERFVGCDAGIARERFEELATKILDNIIAPIGSHKVLPLR
jgi:hypothetical protein